MKCFCSFLLVVNARKWKILSTIILSACGVLSLRAQPLLATSDDGLARSTSYYNKRYQLQTLFDSAVNDHGRDLKDLNDGLNGLRNFRAVLPGILYRAGGNNAYGSPPRDNRNPLPSIAVQNLCSEGFSEGFYLYNINYVAISAHCNHDGSPNAFQYDKLNIANKRADIQKLLATIHSRIVGNDHRPVLVHCFNGYHESGLAAALALRQFCGFSAAEGIRYWDATARPLGKSGRERVHSQISNFTPILSLAISENQRKIVCYNGIPGDASVRW